MPGDGIPKTVAVVLGICLVSSFLVSTAAVKLHPRQQENRRLDKVESLLRVSGLYRDGIDVAQVYAERIEPVLIELRSGKRVGAGMLPEALSVDSFDLVGWAQDPEVGEDVPREKDIAKIRRRPRYIVVYFVRGGNGPEKLILPIYGKGLWSTLYGFLALDRDFATVTGITFYEHAETPGLGGEIDNPRWQDGWRGKRIYDDRGNLVLRVVKGVVDPDVEAAVHQIDGLAGATITTRGVDNLVRYWLGPDGYGVFLGNLRKEYANPDIVEDR